VDLLSEFDMEFYLGSQSIAEALNCLNCCLFTYQLQVE